MVYCSRRVRETERERIRALSISPRSYPDFSLDVSFPTSFSLDLIFSLVFFLFSLRPLILDLYHTLKCSNVMRPLGRHGSTTSALSSYGKCASVSDAPLSANRVMTITQLPTVCLNKADNVTGGIVNHLLTHRYARVVESVQSAKRPRALALSLSLSSAKIDNVAARAVACHAAMLTN